MTHENYLFRKNQFMKAFDRSLEFAQPLVSSWLGEEPAKRFMQEAKQEYQTLMPRIPYIGNNWLLLSFFIPTTRYLAMYRALQRQGRTVEDAGRLAYLIGTGEAEAFPYFVRRFMGYFWFSRLFRVLAKRWQIRSQQGRYPGASVIEYVEGDGEEFDYGIDYLECAVCKFLRAENAFELAPYSCAIDMPVSEKMGWGLTRLKTLAEGYPRCEFRFKKGGETNVPIPSSLQA